MPTATTRRPRDTAVVPRVTELPRRTLTARGASPSLHRERRCARLARRDDREYREYWREEQRRQAGCSAARMQMELHHGLLRPPLVRMTQVFGAGGMKRPATRRVRS